MKLRISNLGVIETMEIDMAKPFILFAGDNGTGKTYASTFLYCLIKNFASQLLLQFSKDEKQLPASKQTKTGWEGNLDANELYNTFLAILKTRKKRILEMMNLNIREDNFKCELITSTEEWSEELKKKEVQKSSTSIKILKKGKNNNYSIAATEQFDKTRAQVILLMSLYFDNIIGTHFLPAERNGIYTFSKELSIGRLRDPDIMTSNRYPRPIADGLANAEDLANAKKRQSKFYILADEIENDLLHGHLSVTDDGDIQFAINGKDNISINESSSAIKTLAPIVFYIRHIANSSILLFIDEPELNLHPKNQILLAKIFVKMINAGLRLVISTHSDYIIREINNMIMADALTKVGSDLPEKQGYDKSLCLSSDLFSPYLFEVGKRGKVTVKPLDVDRYGFSMPSIDEAINRQNEVTDTLYEVLKYDYPNE